jgi:hypothetical protein
MRTIVKFLAGGVVLTGAAFGAAPAANAAAWFGYGLGPAWVGPGVHVGVGVGPAWVYPHPVYVPPPPPPVVRYRQRAFRRPYAGNFRADPGQQYWYFCRNPEGYYPYVQECTSGWEEQPVQSAPSEGADPGGPPQPLEREP